MSDKFSAYEMFDGMRNVTQEELEDLNKLYELWLEEHSQSSLDPNMLPRYGAGGREIEYDEQIIAYPIITSEDLTANHAAGLPLYRERIVRCKDCEHAWAHDGCIECLCHFVQTWDYYNDEPMHTAVRPDGFCSWGKRREAKNG